MKFKLQKIFERSLLLPGWGELSLASLQWALISGVLLIPAFNPAPQAFASVTMLVSKHYLGQFLHSFHSYSADLFLITLVMHVIEYLHKKAFLQYHIKSWSYLVLLSAISVLVVFSGFLSTGSLEALDAGRILQGILSRLAAIGETLSSYLMRASDSAATGTIYLHHVATFTLLTVILTYLHLRRLQAVRYAFVYVFGLLTLLALIFPAFIGFPPQAVVDVVKGPWYFIGLQEMLSWLPVFIAGILFPLIVLILLALLALRRVAWPALVYGLLILLVFYFIESLIGAFLRGAGWALPGS